MIPAPRSALGPSDLVLCAGTVPDTGFHERVEVASRAGYRGIGLRGVDGARCRAEGATGASLRAVLDHHGVAVGELDGLTPWADGSTGRNEALWWLAEQLGSRTLVVVELGRRRRAPEERAELFASVCERAEPLGMLVQLEPLAWSGIPTLADAAEVVRLAGHPRGGVCVDTWHLARSGQGVEDLTTDVTDLVTGVQVSDAPAHPAADLLEETQHRRLLPGDGIADVEVVLHRLRAAGVTAPIGVEVMSDALAAQGPDAAAAAAAEATRRVVAATQAPPGPDVSG